MRRRVKGSTISRVCLRPTALRTGHSAWLCARPESPPPPEGQPSARPSVRDPQPQAQHGHQPELCSRLFPQPGGAQTQPRPQIFRDGKNEKKSVFSDDVESQGDTGTQGHGCSQTSRLRLRPAQALPASTASSQGLSRPLQSVCLKGLALENLGELILCVRCSPSSRAA